MSFNMSENINPVSPLSEDTVLPLKDQELFNNLFKLAIDNYKQDSEVFEKAMDVVVFFLHNRLAFMHFYHIAIENKNEGGTPLKSKYSKAMNFILKSMNEIISKDRKPEDIKKIKKVFLDYFILHSNEQMYFDEQNNTKTKTILFPRENGQKQSFKRNGEGLVNFRFYLLYLLSCAKQPENHLFIESTIPAVIDINDILDRMETCFESLVNLETSLLLFIWFGKEYRSKTVFQNICKLIRIDSNTSFPSDIIKNYMYFFPEDEQDPWIGEGKSLTSIIRGQYDFRTIDDNERTSGLKAAKEIMSGTELKKIDKPFPLLMLARHQFVYDNSTQSYDTNFCNFYSKLCPPDLSNPPFYGSDYFKNLDKDFQKAINEGKILIDGHPFTL